MVRGEIMASHRQTWSEWKALPNLQKG